MSALRGTKRYWYRDERGNNRMVTVRPDQPVEAHWKPGFPPRPQHVADAFAQRMRALHGGVPKSNEQREKMRQRKLGVAKSEEHKETMSRAHLERQPRIREVHKRHPELTYHQASALEARLRKDPNAPSWFRELLHDKA